MGGVGRGDGHSGAGLRRARRDSRRALRGRALWIRRTQGRGCAIGSKRLLLCIASWPRAWWPARVLLRNCHRCLRHGLHLAQFAREHRRANERGRTNNGCGWLRGIGTAGRQSLRGTQSLAIAHVCRIRRRLSRYSLVDLGNWCKQPWSTSRGSASQWGGRSLHTNTVVPIVEFSLPRQTRSSVCSVQWHLDAWAERWAIDPDPLASNDGHELDGCLRHDATLPMRSRG